MDWIDVVVCLLGVAVCIAIAYREWPKRKGSQIRPYADRRARALYYSRQARVARLTGLGDGAVVLYENLAIMAADGATL